MIHGEPTWDYFSLSKVPLSRLLKGKVELSGLWHDDVMVRKWKFALLLVFKDQRRFCYRATHRLHQERALSVSSPSSPTGLKGRMEEKRNPLLPNHGCQIQHAWKKKNIKKWVVFPSNCRFSSRKGAAGGVRRAGMFMKCAGTFEGSSLKEDRWFGGSWQRDTEPFTSRSPGSNAAEVKDGTEPSPANGYFGAAWEKRLVEISSSMAGGQNRLFSFLVH